MIFFLFNSILKRERDGINCSVIESLLPSQKVFEILTLVIVLHYDDFGDLLDEDPLQRYSTDNPHDLQVIIHTALNDCSVSQSVLDSWKTEVKISTG